MAGKIVADQLEHSTAGSIATNFVVEGVAKAYSSVNQSSTLSVYDSFNKSSHTDRGSGSFYHHFSSNYSSVNYNTFGSSSPQSIGSMSTTNNNRATITSPDTTSRKSCNNYYVSGPAVTDDPYVSVLSFGDLA